MQSTAVVTGATGGIGQELCTLLAARGVDLVLVARNTEALKSIAENLQSVHRIRCRVFPADLTDPSAPTAIHDFLRKEGVQPDILINNAGAGIWRAFAGTAPQESLHLIKLNLMPYIHLTHLMLPGMLERHSGRILNVASTAGFVPGPYAAVYYATKAFIISFSEGLCEELRSTGVTVSVLCPGPTRTQFLERAGMRNINLTRSAFMLEPAAVAKSAVTGLYKGKPVIIPGSRYKLLVFLHRAAPRWFMRRFIRLLNV